MTKSKIQKPGTTHSPFIFVFFLGLTISFLTPNSVSATHIACVTAPGGWLNCLSEVDPTDPLGDRIPLILIHGWNPDGVPGAPTPEGWGAFLSFFRQTGSLTSKYKPYYFSYFSNIPGVPILEIARHLRDALDIKNANDPNFGDKPLVILAHSMGGLIARSFMQQYNQRQGAFANKLGGERVVKLITLGTPHHGSPLANGQAFGNEMLLLPQKDLWDLLNLTWLASVRPFEENRFSLHWDNYITWLNYVLFPEERNDWLVNLNANSTYDNKIIAYAGTIDFCFDLLNIRRPCNGAYLLASTFSSPSDGVVPIESALFYSGSGVSRVFPRVFGGYDHYRLLV